MKPEQQRIAIAEACGWDFDPPQAREWESRGKWASGPPGCPALVFRHSIPDYINDLNAMHEAEITLADSPLFAGYEAHLDKVVPLAERWIFATAAQRAEAFLRTIGKWVEE
jgi:hypothetical protein